MRIFSFILLLALSANILADEREEYILQRIFHQAIISNEYQKWDKATVNRVYPANGGKSKIYPKAYSRDTNQALDDTKYFPIQIGKKLHGNIYKLLDVDGKYSGHLIDLSYSSNLEGETGLLVFTSGSVENPNYPSNGLPRYYTTQFYNFYIFK